MENGEEKKEIPMSAPRVRTYERDVEEFLKKEGGTAADFALAEQERRIIQNIPRPPQAGTPFQGGIKKSPLEGGTPTLVGGRDVPKNPPPAPSFIKEGGGGFSASIPSPQTELVRRNARSLVLWSIGFLFLAGAVGVGYWYFSNNTSETPAPVRMGTAKIILAEKEKALDASRLARDTFITAFTREREAGLALSSFTLITPTKPVADATGAPAPRAQTASEFLALLDVSARGDFMRALAPSFVLGLRGLPANRAFLIFKTKYYQTAFAGMLAWESTLLNDLGPLFGSAVDTVPAGTTSDAFTGRMGGFVDRTLHNRDVREALGADGTPLLLWGFADKQTLIIADDEDTFEKTAGRLVAVP